MRLSGLNRDKLWTQIEASDALRVKSNQPLRHLSRYIERAWQANIFCVQDITQRNATWRIRDDVSTIAINSPIMHLYDMFRAYMGVTLYWLEEMLCCLSMK